jgi:hypothetical protein
MKISWEKMGRILGSLVVLGKALLWLLVLVVLLIFSLPALLSPEWENRQEVYLCNRTGRPMHVALTVPRRDVALDTVWWGTTIDGNGFGRAVIVRQLSAYELDYRLDQPALVAGSVDTLLADTEQSRHVSGPLGRRQFINTGPNGPRWDERHRQPKPDFKQEIQVRAIPDQPDSLRLVLPVAPDNSLRVAVFGAQVHNDHRHHNVPLLEQYALHPVVTWRHQDGQLYRQAFPAGKWMRRMEVLSNERGERNYQMTYYIEYR